MRKTITKRVLIPEIGANPSPRYLAEVRLNGWLINHCYFDSELEAQSWLEKQDGETMSLQTALFYLKVIKNHGK